MPAAGPYAGPSAVPAGRSAGPEADRLRRLVEAQRDLAVATPDALTVFHVLAQAVLRVFPAEGAIASQPEGSELVARAAAGTTGPPPGHRIPLSGTLGGRAVATLQGQLCRDSRSDRRTSATLSASTGTRSSIIVPLVHHGEAIAVISAVSSRADAFDAGDLALLEMLAEVAASRLVAALAENARSQLAARTSALAEAVADGLVAQDLDGRVVMCNNGAERVLGVSCEQMCGHTGTDAGLRALWEDGSERPRQQLPAMLVLASGEPRLDDVLGVRTPDGRLRWLQVNSVPTRDGAGAMTGVVSAFTDVTARRALDDVRRVREARLRAAQQLTGLAWWELDLATGEHVWADEMFRLMGLQPGSPPPTFEQFLARIHPDDLPGVDELRRRGYDTGHRDVYRVVWPDGQVRHLRSWTEVERDADGAVTKVTGATIDVTEEEERAASLRASEEHFRVAFDNAPIGMSMIGLTPRDQGRYLRVNAAFLQMLGHSHDELAGTSILELTHPEDRVRDGERFAELVRGELTSLEMQKRYLHRDGHVVHAWVTSSVVHASDGEPLYLVTHALDMSDRLREQAELERLALTDTLTGLANRTLLNDRIDQALARLHRSGGVLAMLLLDVDRFKTVNDSLGHQVGDALLMEVSGRIEAVSRADSTVARLGGDEFVVLVDGLATVEAVHAVAARLLEAVRRPYALGPAAESLTTTVSIGISVAVDASRTPGDLYREADLALYRAKDSGRDQYALFDDDLRARAERRMASETLLRRALQENLLVPAFQPIVDLADGRVHAAEALARIKDGDRLVLPADFIDVAEETGLVVEVDARMFERVAAEGARLLDSGALLRRLTTNVSARSLEDPGFVERMRKALRWYGVPGSMIRVELTEHSLLTVSPQVRESLTRIQELGVHIGVDDFGTGYSALAYLQSFPLQFLKIDRSFVGRLGCSPRDDAVVAAVIDLAHAHDLVVVAEGVETEDQLAALRRMGCDRAQGYLMGRPMPAAELDDLLRTDPRW